MDTFQGEICFTQGRNKVYFIVSDLSFWPKILNPEPKNVAKSNAWFHLNFLNPIPWPVILILYASFRHCLLAKISQVSAQRKPRMSVSKSEFVIWHWYAKHQNLLRILQIVTFILVFHKQHRLIKFTNFISAHGRRVNPIFEMIVSI